MKQVRKTLPMLAGGMAVMILAGCDWSAGGGADSWSDRYKWVDFSGVYRGINGGVLITDYTATPGTPGVTNSVSGEHIGTGDGSATTFSGVLDHHPVVVGTISITAGAFTLTDPDGDGVLSGGGSSGTIDYGTGAWSIDLGGVPLGSGEPIEASYQYPVSGSAGSGAPGPGTSGATIYSFVVHQAGNTLEITDNNGATYEGSLGDVSTTGGVNQDSAVTTPAEGDQVVAQFTAEGISAAGLKVTMAGTFQGVVSKDEDDNYYLSNRKMFGTWIEDGGRTGDINGEASPIPITVTETSSP